MTAVFLQLGVMLLAGIGYRGIPGALPAADIRRVISSIVLNIFIPLLTFGVMSSTPIEQDLLAVPIVSIASCLIGLTLGWLVYGVLLRGRLSPPAIGSLIIASAWCNAMYMGLPITTAAVGEHIDHVPILFDYLGMTPLLFTIGAMISARYGTTQQAPSFMHGVQQIATMPPTIAILLGLGCNLAGLELPTWAIAACEGAGRAIAPLMIFSIGLTLRPPTIATIPMLLPATLTRIIVVPICILPLADMLIVDSDVHSAVMLESAMPTMMLTMVFAERFGLDESTLAQAILLSTIVSVVTLPQLLLWIR